MKPTVLLFIIYVVLTSACQNKSASVDNAPVANFDLTGYESSQLSDGVTRVIKRNQNGLIVEEGYIKDGKKNGVWTTYTNEDRPESITSYLDGKKYGKTFKFSHLIQITDEITYQNDILHGKKGRYKRGRPMEEGHFVNNKAQGVHKLFYESGADQGKLRQSTEFKNGKINGKLRTYNASGDVTTEYDYKNGEKVSGGIVK